MSYCTKGNLQKYLMIDIDSSFDTQVADWISAAESYINKYTGRKDGFEQATASARYYDGSGTTELEIDNCMSISSVIITEEDSDDTQYTLTEGQAEDFITYPYNDTPIYRLKLVAGASVGAFYSGKRRIKVTATWGSASTVPKDITLATTMLVASIIEKGLHGGKLSSESLGDYKVTYADLDESSQALGVKKILNTHKIFKL